jgi:predicted O-methyltransferase YrrM
MMDDKIKGVLAEYAARAEAERQLMDALPPEELGRRINEFLISVGPVVAGLLNEMIKARQARVILELGTSYGYSTLFLAEAARATGGRVITTELAPDKIAYAGAMLAKAGLAEFVEFRQGDARETIAGLQAPIEFVLVDLWKDLYVPCFDLFYPKLAPGALIVADNMIHPPNTRDHALTYRRHIRKAADIETVLLPLGQGIEVSRYAAGLDDWGIAPR